jgi:hypothetical protein
MKEPGFRPSRRSFEIRPDGIARRLVAPQIEVAFGDPEVDQLAIVSGDHALELLKRAARLGVAARAEQHRGPA